MIRSQVDNMVDMYMDPELLPPKTNLVANSTHRLSRLEIQKASQDVRRFVEARLESDFHLLKVTIAKNPTPLILTDRNQSQHTAPLAFLGGTGVNDDLDGSDSKSAVRFTVPNEYIPRGMIQAGATKETPSKYQLECEVVQSLAKWKRFMLTHLDCPPNTGIYCDSTSIRKGYKGDTTHSVIADQWDFEVRLESPSQRTMQQLHTYVRTLWSIIVDAEDFILRSYPAILLPGHPTAEFRLPREIKIITSQELHDMYPTLTVHERETAAVRQYGAIFIAEMGWPMTDGSPPEEVRSPGYDDWNLNGDIIVYHPLTEYRHELSSMGIRVDAKALQKQLQHRGMQGQANLDFFRAVFKDKVVPSYGGGLGISRLLMLLLRTAHIGEVQVGVWHDAHFAQARAAGIDMIPDRILPKEISDGEQVEFQCVDHAYKANLYNDQGHEIDAAQ